MEILILERLKVLRTVSKYSVAGSEPNTVLVAKSDTLGGACTRRPYFEGVRGARRIRRLTDAPLGSQNALTTPQVAPSIFTIWVKWHPYFAFLRHFCVKTGCLSPTKVHSRHLLKHVDPLKSFASRRLADALLSWGVRGARRPNDALVTPLTTPLTTPRAF